MFHPVEYVHKCLIMGKLFKINLIPKVKDRDWEVRNIGANRKVKMCKNCGAMLDVGDSSTTFTKRTSKGSKTDYQTIHTCSYNLKHVCAKAVAKELNIDLDKSFVN